MAQSNPESFSWYLKNIQQSSAQLSETELEINLLRIMELFGPTPIREFIETCKSDPRLPPITKVSEILEKMVKNGEATIAADAAFAGQRVVQITPQGLIKLQAGGTSND